MKMHYKRIMGLLIIAFVFFMTNTLNVFAADCTYTKTCDEWIKMGKSQRTELGEIFVNKYGINYEIEKDDKDRNIIKISMTKDKYKDTKKYKFVIIDVTPFKYTDKEYPGTTIEADKLGDYFTSKNKVLSYDDDIALDFNKITGDDYYAVKIEMAPKGFNDDDIECACKKNKTVVDGFTFTLVVEAGAGESWDSVSVPGSEETSCSDGEGGTSDTYKIDCTGYENKDPNSFIYKFCHIRQNAKDTNSDSKKRWFKFGNLGTEEKFYNAYSSYTKNNKGLETFKCDYTKITDEDKKNDKNVFDVDNKDGYYLNSNSQYFYGKASYEKVVGNYKYYYEKHTYEHNGQPKIENITCKISCEEAVMVEYGPPVATKAGLCFEYKVKVTSYVHCYDDGGEDDDDDNNGTPKCKSSIKPPKTQNICTPYPTCKLSEGSTTSHRQGGPSEDFDYCIRKCDGGKYTDKCVTKCYNQIYKTGSNKKTNVLNYTPTVKKVAEDNLESKIISAPKYEYANGKIVWNTTLGNVEAYLKDGVGNIERNIPSGTCANGNPGHVKPYDSTWHDNNVWGTTSCSGYTSYSGTGIPRTPSCKETCKWEGCTGDDIYLNKEQATKDKDDNEDEYKRAKDACKAAASCSTSTATFSISVDYNLGTNEKKIEYPLSTGKDELVSHGNKQTTPNTSTNEDTTILNYNGCYANNMEGNNVWYQTEWSFPGVWFDEKHKVVSFEPKSGGYLYKKNVVCLPKKARSVNTKWWNLYYQTLQCKDKTYAYGDKTYQSGVSNKAVNDKCEPINGIANEKNSVPVTINECSCEGLDNTARNIATKDIKWNIKANTTSFGHFGWKIDMECFYAMSRIFECTEKIGKENDSKVNQLETKALNDDKCLDYRVRSVDLKDMFPSDDGTKHNSSVTGRSPGYNWSAFANQTKSGEDAEDNRFYSKPAEYVKWVQETAYGVYSDQYLDYAITLTKDDIKELKSQHNEYTKFDGNVDVNNVTNYKSKYIRNKKGGNGLLLVYPSVDSLRCNNLGTHSADKDYTAKCANFEGGEINE